MKILLINNFHYRKGGSEAVYFNTAELLQKYGHEVIFFSYKREENVPCKQMDYFVGQGGKVQQILSYFYNIKAAQNLERLVENEQPDIAHVHLFWGGISPSIFRVLQKHHIPLVHTAHDYRMVCPAYTFKDGTGKTCESCKQWNYYECIKKRCSKGSLLLSTMMAMEMYTRQLFHSPIKNISGFIFVSHFSEQKHIKHHLSFRETKHIVLYNYTNPLLSPDINKKGDYLLFFGRLSFEKGIPTLLKVFARHPEWNLKVVGTGPLENQLKSEYTKKENANVSTQQENCYENIEFLGYRFGNTLSELVRNAKYVCVPSECYENNPMTIVESYSLGTPVIGANIGGIPEIIEEEETGFLFKSGDTDDLEKVVIKAINVSTENYKEMCENSYHFYEKHFSAESHYEQLIKFYESIINNYNI